jgi:hypothetical protein
MLLKRLLIGLVTLGAAVGAFWFYSQYHRTPDLSSGISADANETLKEAVNLGGQGGEVGDGTKINKGEKVYFEQWDDDYRVLEMTFGFDTMLYKGPSLWQLVKPYMTLYESEVTCFVTADSGVFRIEEVGGKPKPRDVTFSGAVKVHILPKPGSDIEEIRIDLEEFVFLSSKSQFSSSGQIQVRSPSIRLSGQGVDFIYNAGQEAIQYFRMVQLNYLRVRTPREGGLFSFGKNEETPAETKVADANEMITEAQEVRVPSDPLGPIYTCLLQDNVVIRSPKQKIHSLSHIVLTDILWPKSAFGRQAANQLDPNATETVVADANALSLLEPNGVAAAASSSEDPNMMLGDEDMFDIIITCDGGILISPADSNWTPESEGLAKPEVTQVVDVNVPSFAEDLEDDGIFLAQDIEYNVKTKNAKAQGPVELTFYAPPDSNELDARGHLIPINVTAQKYGQFDANDHSIVFTDDCTCILQKHDANNVVEEFRLDAPKIRIELVDEKDAQAIASRQDLKHIEAVGGGVTLGIFTRVSEASTLPATFSPATGELLAGAEMTCESFEFDPSKGREVFTAKGPGIVMLNNAKAVPDGSSDKKKEPYYASLKGFETMKYYVADNLIVADTQDPNVLLFKYVPVGEDPNMEGQANHVEIHLVKTEAGQTEMGTLTATGNVSMSHGQNQFTGGFLSYSHDTMRLIIRPGEAAQVCTVNGMSYPGIDYNLSTGELKTSLSPTLSVLPLN